ncbi:serine/arginine-rich splicing factor 9-like isoform X3 [Salvelinus namaycush]|uniref:Serine/arginine-rich splicing factor 9 n=2 Tax=Salvelinus TaxID=8033 RepID=A0A8U0TUH4_SALNM|nr:serine/arginine-rich splicing factor 9-like isoform X3 [Salvelinus namaycush]
MVLWKLRYLTMLLRSSVNIMADGRIYVGNLPADVQERDIEDIFFKYGKIRDIELKNNRGTIPFAFVRFEDPRDAEDAVYGRNGYGFGDCKLRVEHPRSASSKFNGSMGGSGRGSGDGGPGGPKGRFGPPTRRSEFRVIVTGLPPTGSWQDLKDHMREAGDVCFTDVQRDGEGVVEFLRREDMEYAMRRLDRTEFRSHQGETSSIRVHGEMGASRGRSRSRSRSRGRYSPAYQGRGSPPPRYQSPPARRLSRHSPPPRRSSAAHRSPSSRSPPPRHYR